MLRVTPMPDPSIKEVARLAGVSIATVSRCMNTPEVVRDKTRAKVEAAIAQIGYSPNELAQSFRRGRTNRVMVVLPSVGDPFFTPVVRGVRTAARAKGYSILLMETQHGDMTADELGAVLVSKQTDGVILLASASPFGTELLSSQHRKRLPIVIGCETVSPELAGLPSVHIDNLAAAREAVAYLTSRGHARVAIIRGEKSSLLTQDRELGYRAGMRDAGHAVEEGWVVEGDMSLGGAVRATRELLHHRRPPTAILCANDEMAMGCLHAVKSAGLAVPADVSVMGFDDMRYAAFMDPPLTTIAQPAEEIGERVMYRLYREMEDRGGASEYAPEIVPHRLVVRQSVAAPTR